MMRRIGLVGLWVVCIWLGGCFSGGKVVDEGTEDGGLHQDGGAGEDGASDLDGGDGEECREGTQACGDECVDTSSSEAHCGGCGIVCEAVGANTEASCIDGGCEQTCSPGFVDADEDTTNGCEFECAPSNGGAEICDGLDNDCDGTVDEDDAADAPIWYADADDDGFGDAQVQARACEKPDGYADNDTDCDDANAEVHTEIEGYADQDDDGFTTGGAQMLCTGGALPQGYVSNPNAEDCDDAAAQANPSVPEVCDGLDNDCDGTADEEEAEGITTWYIDCDGDGFAAETFGARDACEKPSPPMSCVSSSADWTDTRPSTNSTDCNDDEANAFPGQTSWFTVPMTGGNYNDKWDYDCNGYADRQYKTTDATCTSCDSASGDQSGWVDNFHPSCGQSDSYQQCLNVFFCQNEIISRTQACR